MRAGMSQSSRIFTPQIFQYCSILSHDIPIKNHRFYSYLSVWMTILWIKLPPFLMCCSVSDCLTQALSIPDLPNVWLTPSQRVGTDGNLGNYGRNIIELYILDVFCYIFLGAPSRCSEPFSDRGRWVGTCFNHSIRRTWLVLVVTEISTSLSPLNDNEVGPRLRNLHILGPSLPSFEERWIAYEFWINLRSALDYLMKNGEIDIYWPAIASKNK